MNLLRELAIIMKHRWHKALREAGRCPACGAECYEATSNKGWSISCTKCEWYEFVESTEDY